MSAGAVFMLIVCSMFPGLILVALAVKLWEVRKASRWPATNGVVKASRMQSKKNQPGDPGYNFSDTEISNEPYVEYEYVVAGKKLRCTRITIGEKTAGFELESILERYPVGTEVTVYYDPADPTKAVLERDLPMGMMLGGVGCLLAFFIGGPVIAALAYFDGVAWLKSHLDDPTRAPFVAAATGFAVACLWFSIAFQRMVARAHVWPVTRGRIVASGVDRFQHRDTDDGTRRTHYKSNVVYAYEVNGRQFQGDRLTIGVIASSTLPGHAKRVAAKYPIGAEVDVHYNPEDPGESTLHPGSSCHILLWLVTAGMFALAWAVATERI